MPVLDCSTCGRKFRSSGGLCQHNNTFHRSGPAPQESTQHTRINHEFLNGMFEFPIIQRDISLLSFNLAQPCNKDGDFLRKGDGPPTKSTASDSDNPWTPFQDRLAFDWAYYHFIRLQSSKSDILEGLDLWRATVIKHESSHTVSTEDVPWSNADSLYETIDAIQDGDAPWKCFKFSYTGPKPLTPPAWMEESYELNTRDVLLVLEQQLAASEFDGEIDYIPYREFTAKGDRIYSNLMSGHWAYREAVRVHICLYISYVF